MRSTLIAVLTFIVTASTNAQTCPDVVLSDSTASNYTLYAMASAGTPDSQTDSDDLTEPGDISVTKTIGSPSAVQGKSHLLVTLSDSRAIATLTAEANVNRGDHDVETEATGTVNLRLHLSGGSESSYTVVVYIYRAVIPGACDVGYGESRIGRYVAEPAWAESERLVYTVEPDTTFR